MRSCCPGQPQVLAHLVRHLRPHGLDPRDAAQPRGPATCGRQPRGPRLRGRAPCSRHRWLEPRRTAPPPRALRPRGACLRHAVCESTMHGVTNFMSIGTGSRPLLSLQIAVHAGELLPETGALAPSVGDGVGHVGYRPLACASAWAGLHGVGDAPALRERPGVRERRAPSAGLHRAVLHRHALDDDSRAWCTLRGAEGRGQRAGRRPGPPSQPIRTPRA